MVALSAGILEMSVTDALDPVHEERFHLHGSAQVGPVGPAASGDHVVDRRGRIAFMVQMPVPHTTIVARTR